MWTDEIPHPTKRIQRHEDAGISSLPARACNDRWRRTDNATHARANIPAAQVLTSMPANAATITHWYKQPVYDPSDNRIGEIEDVLVDRDAKIVALLIGVGGFLGIGEKHVAVPYNAVRATTKDNNKWYMVMNSTKDALKNAPGYKYDRSSMAWMPENAPATAPTAR